jgi:hypothetical protein
MSAGGVRLLLTYEKKLSSTTEIRRGFSKLEQRPFVWTHILLPSENVNGKCYEHGKCCCVKMCWKVVLRGKPSELVLRQPLPLPESATFVSLHAN